MLTKDTVVAYTDGGSRGNPGPAGFGVRLESADGTVIGELHEALGVATNNIAEYRGLLAALAWALDHGYRRLHVRSDSQLLIRQMRGEYRVKNPGLQQLHREARDLVARFERVGFEHIPREQNDAADRLANLAMDEAEGRRPHASHAAPRPLEATGQHGSAPEPALAPRPPRAPSSRQGGLPFDDSASKGIARSRKRRS